MARTRSIRTLKAYVRSEWFLAISAATSLYFVVWGAPLHAKVSDPAWLTFTLFWLFAVILGSALCVVRHAKHLAARLGEPYGTLILTMSVTFIEVMSISAIMLHGDNNPTLPRDTLFAGESRATRRSRIARGVRRSRPFSVIGSSAPGMLIIPVLASTTSTDIHNIK